MLIRDVAVLDVRTGSVAVHRDVRIEGDVIAAVVPTGAEAAADLVVDGRGLTLLPGLIDVHTHLESTPDPPWDGALPDPELNMLRYLYAGVTTVFDTGSSDDGFERRSELEDGEVLGPHLYAAGPIFTAPGGHPVPMFEQALPDIIEGWIIDGSVRQVASGAEAQREVEAWLRSSPDFLKVVLDRIPAHVPRLDPAVARAAIETARAGGVRAVAHVGTTTDALDAARAGVAAWVHGVYKERIPDAAVAELASFRIPMAPTLVVFESYATLGREPRVPTALEREIAGDELLGRYDERPEDFELLEGAEAYLEMLGRQRTHARENVRRLHAAGVTILAGSDAQAAVFHGAGLHRELALLEKAGLSRAEVLRAATLYAARFLSGREDPPYGVVEPEKRADLLLVEGDPLEDLRALSRIREVFLDGVSLVRRAK